jgi:hypothetical protein
MIRTAFTQPIFEGGRLKNKDQEPR